MIHELTYQVYGKIRYFEADRFFNTEKFKAGNQGKIICGEIVSYDCGLFNMYEMLNLQQPLRSDTAQIIAVIVRPDIRPDRSLENDGFVFCGYDLVEEATAISAITNCGGGFKSIPYDNLTAYALIPTYEDAVLVQQALLDEDPEEPHADCEICEIWRKIV